MHCDRITKEAQKTQSTGALGIQTQTHTHTHAHMHAHTHTHIHTHTHTHTLTDEWQQLDGETKHVRTEER